MDTQKFKINKFQNSNISTNNILAIQSANKQEEKKLMNEETQPSFLRDFAVGAISGATIVRKF